MIDQEVVKQPFTKQPIKRISLVVFLRTDENTAKQLVEAVKLFIKKNFKLKDENIDSSIRTKYDGGVKYRQNG